MSKINVSVKNGLKLTAISVAAVGLMFSSAGSIHIRAAGDSSVSGSGEWAGITITVGAVNHEDTDETTGSAMFHDRDTNSRLNIEITSISIEMADQLATLQGEITKSTGSYAKGFPVGAHVSFQVEDEGEGNAAIPDGFTFPVAMGAPAPAPFPRKDGGILPASERGNLQVRGVSNK